MQEKADFNVQETKFRLKKKKKRNVNRQMVIGKTREELKLKRHP